VISITRTTWEAPVTPPDERRLLTPEEYREAQNSPEFAELRRRFRRFAFPMTVAFLAWYLLYVLLSTYADGLLAKQVFGSNLNWGIVLGLAQFVTTFLITQLYVRHANRNTDPIADEMRERLEHHEYAHGAPGAGEGTTQGPTLGATRG
jgi:uncharacterized membrane protein (DUF485 family)